MIDWESDVSWTFIFVLFSGIPQRYILYEFSAVSPSKAALRSVFSAMKICTLSEFK